MGIWMAIQGKTRNLSALAGVIVIGAGLSACESARDPELLENPNYSYGYADGCQTGHTRVSGFDDTIVKNRELAAREPAYEVGWRDGYDACGGYGEESVTNSNREIFQHESEHYTTVPR